MTEFSYAPIEDCLASLLSEIDTLRGGADGADITRLDKLTRLIQTQLKTLETLQAREVRLREARRSESFTPFEKLAPPPPAERTRMIRIINRHFGVSPAQEQSKEPRNDRT